MPGSICSYLSAFSSVTLMSIALVVLESVRHGRWSAAGIAIVLLGGSGGFSIAHEPDRSPGAPVTSNVCATDTSMWSHRARSAIGHTLSLTDYSGVGLPFRPDPATITIATDQATCDAAYSAQGTAFGTAWQGDSILVVRIGTAGYVVYEDPDPVESLNDAWYWTSTWAFLFSLVEI